MGFTADVVADAPIASSWGNEIRNRTIQRFASVAERTSQWPSPPEGALSYVDDSDRLFVYTGSAWRYIAGGAQPLYAARMYRNAAVSTWGAGVVSGICNYDTVDYDYNSNCTTGASAKYTCPVDGLYHVNAAMGWESGGSDRVYLSIHKNATEVRRGVDMNLPAITMFGSCVVSADIVCAANDYLDIRWTHATGPSGGGPQSGNAIHYADFRLL